MVLRMTELWDITESKFKTVLPAPEPNHGYMQAMSAYVFASATIAGIRAYSSG
jgi:hypothetical protein